MLKWSKNHPTEDGSQSQRDRGKDDQLFYDFKRLQFHIIQGVFPLCVSMLIQSGEHAMRPVPRGTGRFKEIDRVLVATNFSSSNKKALRMGLINLSCAQVSGFVLSERIETAYFVRGSPVFVTLPQQPKGLVLFAHGSGSSRHSRRNRYVAERFQQAGLGTLLMDLLTSEEECVDEHTQQHRFDIPLLAGRLSGTIPWLGQRQDTESPRCRKSDAVALNSDFSVRIRATNPD